MDVGLARGPVPLGDRELLIQCHQPPNQQLYLGRRCATTMASVSLESVYTSVHKHTHKPFLPGVDSGLGFGASHVCKILRALVVLQNLVKTTVSYGSHDWSAHLGDITRKHYKVC